MTGKTPYILEIKELKKEFSGFSLKNIGFSMEKGCIMGFIGPNGAGKTTTIKLIMNLLKKDGGEIKVFGLDNVKHEKEIKNRIGFVYDENCFYEELSLDEMKRVIAPYYKDWDEGAFEEYLRRFSLPRNKKIKELSRGMKMKYALAIALSHKAELLIMDEPTSGLDPLVRSELLEVLADVVQDEDKGVFFSTHITSDLEKIADYITFINNGSIVFSGAKDEILDNYGMVKGPTELLDAYTRKHFIGVKESSFGFEGLVSDKRNARKVFGDKVIIEKPTLDDIMVYISRRESNG
ncbi:MAG: ABC transporter ATP-binding protein [Clostridiaceae bacterium]|nr:ABC transporter ATP-binding protein [Clostridiaceae bacterium]